MDLLIVILLILTITKLFIMGDNLNEIKAQVQAAQAKVDKVAADVQRLHDLINNAGETPTTEEWNDVKTLVGDLNTALQAVDDVTPE